VPQDVPLKDAKEFHIIGKPAKRLDTPDKVNGSAQYGIDVRQSGMVLCSSGPVPCIWRENSELDATKAKAVPGVKDVIQISDGIAVVADNTWTAMEGRKALDVKWDEGPNSDVSSAGISKLLADRATQPGAVAREEGDVEAGLASAVQKIEAEYEVPFLRTLRWNPRTAPPMFARIAAMSGRPRKIRRIPKP